MLRLDHATALRRPTQASIQGDHVGSVISRHITRAGHGAGWTATIGVAIPVLSDISPPWWDPGPSPYLSGCARRRMLKRTPPVGRALSPRGLTCGDLATGNPSPAWPPLGFQRTTCRLGNENLREIPQYLAEL